MYVFKIVWICLLIVMLMGARDFFVRSLCFILLFLLLCNLMCMCFWLCVIKAQFGRIFLSLSESKSVSLI